MHGGFPGLSVAARRQRAHVSLDRQTTRKTSKMTSFLDDLKKRRSYNRTMRELSRLPLDTALDLDIYAGDIRDIARRAVYGD